MAVKKEKANITIKEELRKVTDVMSKEQIKRPKMIFLTASLSIAAVLIVFAFAFPLLISGIKSNFNFFKKMPRENNIIMNETVKDDTIEKNIEMRRLLESESQAMNAKAGKKDIVSTESNIEKEDKIATESDVKTDNKNNIISGSKTNKQQNVISSAILNKAQIKKANSKPANDNVPILNKILPKYDTELYSYATYYQYPLEDVKAAYKQLEVYYKMIKDDIFGDIDFGIKADNGRIYLNYVYMGKFIEEVTDIDISKYDLLQEVQTTDNAVIFDFKSAKDMGMYYEVPARYGNTKINLMILKGAKVALSESFALTTTLEVIDLEWNTKNNPYFDIEDVIGPSPNAKDFTGFDLVESLKVTKFNRIRYDKKGYITDLFYFK